MRLTGRPDSLRRPHGLRRAPAAGDPMGTGGLINCGDVTPAATSLAARRPHGLRQAHGPGQPNGLRHTHEIFLVRCGDCMDCADSAYGLRRPMTRRPSWAAETPRTLGFAWCPAPTALGPTAPPWRPWNRRIPTGRRGLWATPWPTESPRPVALLFFTATRALRCGRASNDANSASGEARTAVTRARRS